MKSVLWRVAKRLSYIEDARCLKVKYLTTLPSQLRVAYYETFTRPYIQFLPTQKFAEKP